MISIRPMQVDTKEVALGYPGMMGAGGCFDG